MSGPQTFFQHRDARNGVDTQVSSQSNVGPNARNPVAPVPLPPGRLRLYFGDEAQARLGDEEFLRQWQILQKECPWATVFQDQDFVLPWYRIYQDSHTPLLIMEESDSGTTLSALMTLALRSGGQRLVAAGDVHAEYQCWMQAPDADGLFFRKALQMLVERFPAMHFSLRYLPANAPVGTLTALTAGGMWCRLESHPLPLIEVNRECLATPLANRKVDVKRRTRKLEKYGPVQFEQLTDPDEFARIFDEICDQYDFRQAAAYNYTPFSDDPRKKAFHLELHRRGMLFVTVLKVGEQLAASDCAMLTRRDVLHNCVNTHLPGLAAASPGILHFAWLETFLARADIPLFDLTPGASRHKDFFATTYSTAFEFNAYGGVINCLQHRIPLNAKQILKRLLERFGARPRSFRNAVAACLKSASAFRLRFLAERRFVCADDAAPDSLSRIGIAKDRLADLLHFDAGGRPFARQEFFSNAMARLDRLGHVYTAVEGGRLLYSVWVDKPVGNVGEIRKAGRGAKPPAIRPVFALYDLVRHEQAFDPDSLCAFLGAAISDLRAAGAGAVELSGRFDRNTLEAVRRCRFLRELPDA